MQSLGLEGAECGPPGADSPSMVMPGARGVHAEGAIALRRPAFPQPAPHGLIRRLRPTHQSCGITCAQTAIIPTNSAIDASAAASSTNIRNMIRLPNEMRTYEEHCSFFVPGVKRPFAADPATIPAWLTGQPRATKKPRDTVPGLH